ncbi:beta-lactamase family protein [Brachybacterium sp. JHP9]|uniref:Beta-lactamase family protein n=1 Tax=Brachybacterium equifaecis TaxID=2910770 RepID=A0ABT0R049_9MICO|nr:serine hydrolase domain-containing protein [Brachybacterium equifaecis]MCL6423285.1 beta-lactamase family protein [Brachybacterium equifaecis]
MPETPAAPAPPASPSRRTLLGAGIPAVAALGVTAALGSPRPAVLGEPTGDADLAAALSPQLTSHRRVAVALLGPGAEPRFAGFGADENRDFEIGSATKTFTGALLMAAVEAGEVELATTVAEVLPEAAGTAVADVTFAELASHTSGLPRLGSSLGLSSIWTTTLRKDPYAGQSPDDVIADALRSPLTGRGTVAYSNLGAALEGQLLAKIGGDHWDTLLFERILDPLGMTRTFAPITPNRLGDADPRGHSSTGHRAAAWTMNGYAPTGGIRSTAADMARYLRAVIDGAAPVGSGLEPIARENPAQQVAVHWFRTQLASGTEMIWHNGMTGGFASFIGFAPASGRGVVLLTDTANTLDNLGVSILDGSLAA